VVLKVLALRTANERYNEVTRFWARIFGLNFAMGVVTGIPLEFQFGTNWARFSTAAGEIIGQTLALEGVFAFILESAFLGLFLFGEKRLGPRAHLAAALALFVGSWLSGYFIIATNAFMQHPVGYTRGADGALHLADFWALRQPNVQERKLENPIVVPGALSFLAYGTFGSAVKGLNDFPQSDWPDNVELLYFAYHIMVGLGTIFILVMAASALLLWRNRLQQARRMLWVLMLAFPFPYIATTAGWWTAELGRQPWVVHGLPRTAAGGSPGWHGRRGLHHVGLCRPVLGPGHALRSPGAQADFPGPCGSPPGRA
jgi:cytochrome bd-type quinol oxidase subunit 1